MKNKRINLLLILCFSLIFFITSFDCAYAAEENGSLNIILTYERQAIDGAEFSVYQVAKCNEKESRHTVCLLYTSPSPRDRQKSRMPSSA